MTVQKSRVGNSGYTAESSEISYTNQGDIFSKVDKTHDLGTVVSLFSTTYAYLPTVGVSKTMTVSPLGQGTSRTTTYLYDDDPKWRYPTGVVNTLGQTASKTYDPRWGSVLTETDITGLTTTYTYDGFGRVTNVLTPQGHTILKQYLWSYNAELLPLRCYDIVTTTPGKPQTWDVYDAFGRVVVATHQSYGDVNNRHTYTYVVTEYEAKGNVTRKTTPVNANNWSSEVEYTTSSYNHLNQLTSQSNLGFSYKKFTGA